MEGERERAWSVGKKRKQLSYKVKENVESELKWHPY